MVIYGLSNPARLHTQRLASPLYNGCGSRPMNTQSFTYATVSTGLPGGSIPVYDLPNPESAIITNLREGDTVRIDGKPYRGWLPIRVTGLTGFVQVKYTNYYK